MSNNDGNVDRLSENYTWVLNNHLNENSYLKYLKFYSKDPYLYINIDSFD